MTGNVSRRRAPLRGISLSILLLAAGSGAGCRLPPATISADVCAGAEVAGEAVSLVPKLLDIFRGGGADWEATADRVAAGVKIAGSLACAASRVYAHLNTPTPSAGAPAAEPDPADVVAVARARIYLRKLHAEPPETPSGIPASPPPSRPPASSPAAPGAAPR